MPACCMRVHSRQSALPFWGIWWATVPTPARCWSAPCSLRSRGRGHPGQPRCHGRAATCRGQQPGQQHSALDPPATQPSPAQLAGRPALTAASGAAVLVHASADAPARWHYVHDVRAASASLDAAANCPACAMCLAATCMSKPCITGGPRRPDEVPAAAGRGRAGAAAPPWLCTVGSVGQPRDGKPQASTRCWTPIAGY